MAKIKMGPVMSEVSGAVNIKHGRKNKKTGEDTTVDFVTEISGPGPEADAAGDILRFAVAEYAKRLKIGSADDPKLSNLDWPAIADVLAGRVESAGGGAGRPATPEWIKSAQSAFRMLGEKITIGEVRERFSSPDQLPEKIQRILEAAGTL